MDVQEIVRFCIEKGILLDNDLLDLFKDSKDANSVKLIIEKITQNTQHKIITREIIEKNKEHVFNIFSELPFKDREQLEELTVKLGFQIEITGKRFSSLNEEKNKDDLVKITVSPEKKDLDGPEESKVFVYPNTIQQNKKLDIKNFTEYFRNRFLEIRDVLKEHGKLKNLVSINKIPRDNQKTSVIGMVFSKKTTKNKNIILEVEDLTGKINVLINQTRPEIYKQAEDITPDSVMGFNGFGNKDIIFANEIIFPELINSERKKAPVEEYALFISDVHVGSKNFLEKSFLKFIDYLNGDMPNTPEFSKIKYLFVVGDLIAGIGVYPGQEKLIEIKDIEGQYARAAELFGKIRKDIKIIFIPGNHDCVRLMEPQPKFDEKFAWPLYSLKNAIIAPNPSMVNIAARDDFQGFNVLLYHGFSYFYYANTIPSLILGDALNSPGKIMTYLLKNRHLAPTHTSVQYYPSQKDDLLIRKTPDIFVSGHLHKNTVSTYNNTLLITNSCWESLMPYQEKYGRVNVDYCKVPMVNLKTREVKILDFYEGEE